MANDTHGAIGIGWYGFDLDGTLAKYDKWNGIDSIGEPIGPMVKLIKKMHEAGKVVKILTARVSPRVDVEVKPNPYYGAFIGFESEEAACWADESDVLRQELWSARNFIECWCAANLGFVPEITHEKDHLMLELYDDRVKQVLPNEGILLDDIAKDQCEKIHRLKTLYSKAADRIIELEFVNEDRKLRRYFMYMSMFILGVTLMAAMILVSEWCTRPEGDLHTAVEELREAAFKFQRLSRPTPASLIFGEEGGK